MIFKNITYNLVLPFRNLTVQERTLQIFRLSTGALSLLFVIASLIGSLFSHKIYIARIDCAHLDVSYGLYESLTNSVSSASTFAKLNSNLPQDTTLTDSTIELLSAYAESQVENAPQYILSSLWSWCYGNYNLTNDGVINGKTQYRESNVIISCSKTMEGFAFDYKQELEDIGLSSIIAYAYDSSAEENKKFAESARRRSHEYRMVPTSFIVCGGIQVIVFIFMYVIYSNRGPEKDLSRIPGLLLNILTILTVASFLSIIIGVGIITTLISEVKVEIENQLADFGISLHFGSVWFSTSWAAVAFSLLSTLSWAIPLWCANPTDIDEDEEITFDRSNLNAREMTDMSRKNPAGGASILSVSNKYIDPRKDLLEESTTEICNSDEDPFNSANVHDDEDALRRLGESISRKTTIRHTNPKGIKKSKSNFSRPINEEETKNLLYNDLEHDQYMHYPAYYKEATYDGYEDSGNNIESSKKSYNSKTVKFARSRSDTAESNGSATIINPFQIQGNEIQRSNTVKERIFEHNVKGNSLLHLNSPPKRNSFSESILNEDEMNILDYNTYVNKLK